MTPACGRGFPEQEYRDRVAGIQVAMGRSGIDALLLTTEADLRYVSGFQTRFWESPTRPWFLLLPQSGDPVAVIPAIGAVLMRKTWVKDIRTWNAPDYHDDGVSLLADSVTEILGGAGRLGLPSGLESHLRMPLTDWDRLRARLLGITVGDDSGILRRVRMTKSTAETAKIRTACGIADRAFARVSEIAAAGVALDEVFRGFQILCLQEGADAVPYLAGGAGPGGYADVISPASMRPLQAGDVLMLDTGAVFDGYFCDFDRNFSIGPPDRTVRAAHAMLVDATRAVAEQARAGATAADLSRGLVGRIARDGGTALSGRLGHGLGLQLTEGLSLIPDDHTVLEPGMVLTLEPGLELPDGRIMVHEENIVVTDGAGEFLSTPAARDIAVLGPTS